MRRLLIRPGAIGDVILFLPVLEAARAEYTEVWAPRPVLPLLKFADKTRAIADTGLELVGVRDNTRVPALETFDSIYSWYGAKHDEFRSAVAHLPFSFFPALPPPTEGIPRIRLPETAVGDFAVSHPFASSPAKRWPLEHFRAVAARLAASELRLPMRWTAGPEETLPEELARDASLFADLGELAAWLAKARVYIGNDSGISHLAAAAGVPTVAIFLATDPRIWAPRGPHVRVLVQPGVEEVYRAVRDVIR